MRSVHITTPVVVAVPVAVRNIVVGFRHNMSWIFKTGLFSRFGPVLNWCKSGGIQIDRILPELYSSGRYFRRLGFFVGRFGRRGLLRAGQGLCGSCDIRGRFRACDYRLYS